MTSVEAETVICSVENKLSNDEKDGIQRISAFRRAIPQFLGAMAKNLMIVNLGEFGGFAAIVIPSLTGFSGLLNPDETVTITAEQASWLSSFAAIAHPIGSLLSGPICDKVGRRRAIVMVNIPLAICWLILGFSRSFAMISGMFVLIGFCFGLKEAPSFIYISEISEPSIRGLILTISGISYSLGTFIVLTLGSIFSWRQVSLICALTPICCLTAIFFVPETPAWLLSKGRVKDAEKSLQWLRGWVSPQTVRKELTELQNYSKTSNACSSCAKRSIQCEHHSRQTVCDKIKEIKRRRNIRPLIFILCMNICYEFNGAYVLEPYNIQILNALGSSVEANVAMVWISGFGIVGSIFLIAAIKRLGRRKIYLTSIFGIAVLCVALAIYGFAFFPLGWTSFKKNPNEPPKDLHGIRQRVGHYSYLIPIIFMTMRFLSKTSIDCMTSMYVGEVFPFKLRSFLCGIAVACDYLLFSISTKIYFNIEMWLSLPGANLFYGILGFLGFGLMYFIMPETEQRSLENIERHYSDNTKGLFDIKIPKSSNEITEENGCKVVNEHQF